MTLVTPLLPKFTVKKSLFYSELKSTVDNYFRENKIDKKGNWKLYIKTIFWVLLLLSTYLALIYYPNLGIIPRLVISSLMGISFSGIGMNIVHDSAHEGYSHSKTFNSVLAYLFDLVGASSLYWRPKHNIIHHTYANINRVDEDIDTMPFLRLTLTQENKWYHKYQKYYAIPLYGFIYFAWISVNDFRKFFTGKIGIYKIPGIRLVDKVIFILFKLVYVTSFFIIPWVLIGWENMLLNYLTAGVSAGICLGIIFQLAHAVNNTEFPVPDEVSGDIKTDFALHQLRTTNDFAMQNKFVSWLVGGLNFQVEHHLFPHISHVHYPALQPIVQATCEKYGLPYNFNKTFTEAIKNHLSYLDKIGNGK